MRLKFVLPAIFLGFLCAAAGAPAAAQEGPCVTYIEKLIAQCDGQWAQPANPYWRDLNQPALKYAAPLEDKLWHAALDTITRRNDPRYVPGFDIQNGVDFTSFAYQFILGARDKDRAEDFLRCAQQLESGTALNGCSVPGLEFFRSADVQEYYRAALDYNNYVRLPQDRPPLNTPQLVNIAWMAGDTLPEGFSRQTQLIPPGPLADYILQSLPGAPPLHFADGTPAPRNWPGCDLATGLCPRNVMIDLGGVGAMPVSASGQDAMLRALREMFGFPGGSDGGSGAKPDDELEEPPDAGLSASLSHDALPCEIDPTQPRCAWAAAGGSFASAPGDAAAVLPQLGPSDMSDTLSQENLPCDIDSAQPQCLPEAASILADAMGAAPPVGSEGTPQQAAVPLPPAVVAVSRPLPSVALLPSGQWDLTGDRSSGARLDPFTPLAIAAGQSPWQ